MNDVGSGRLHALNQILVVIVDAALAPFAGLPPVAGLAVMSLLTAAGMLAVYRAASDQAGIAAVKRAIHAGLFEIRLFSDDLRAILRAQGEILRHNLTYLRLSAVPLLWMLVPLLLLIVQLQFHYGYGGIEPGAATVVTVRFRGDGAGGAARPGARPDATLAVPDGLRVETPPVWIPSLNEAAWRIAADAPGTYVLDVRVDQERFTKTLLVSDGTGRRSPVRVDGRALDQLLYPSEPPLPDAARVASIAVSYPARGLDVLGREVHWMIVYFVLALVFALVLRRPFGVQI